MTKYHWKSDKIKLLRMLRNSRTLKIKHGWTRESGAGFIADDVVYVDLYADKSFLIHFTWGEQGFDSTADLNLRETEELIKFLERKKP